MTHPLHVVTDDCVLAGKEFLSRARSLLEAADGRVALHVRGPRTSGRTLYHTVSTLAAAAGGGGPAIFVNDRVDVALALPVDGVHLRSRSLPPAVVRRMIGRDTRLGVSIHSAREAEERGIATDYLMAGAVFETPTHPGGVSLGIEGLAEICGIAGPPVIAIGGISPSRVERVLAAGATGVAALSGIWGAEDPASALNDYLCRLT